MDDFRRACIADPPRTVQGRRGEASDDPLPARPQPPGFSANGRSDLRGLRHVDPGIDRHEPGPKEMRRQNSFGEGFLPDERSLHGKSVRSDTDTSANLNPLRSGSACRRMSFRFASGELARVNA